MTIRPEELRARLARCPPVGSRWRSHQGEEYTVEGCALQEANFKPLVLLRKEATGIVYARSLGLFTADVRVAGKGWVKRFEPIPAHAAGEPPG